MFILLYFEYERKPLRNNAIKKTGNNKKISGDEEKNKIITQ